MIEDLKPLFPKLKNFAGIEAILLECQRQLVYDKCQIAYIIATVKHETAGTMMPIEEYGKGHNRTYGHRVWYNGNEYFDLPFIYYGRGFTQNTWRDIYKRLTGVAKRSGQNWDFENKPELLLQIEPSAWVTVYAMNTGLYTGRKLSQYFNDQKTDWTGARKIINGQEKAELIASYAKELYTAIS